MARVGRRARQQRIRQLVLGTVALMFAIGVVGSAAYYLNQREAPPDPVTLCPPKGPKGHIVLLVDKTDPLNFTQKQAFSVVLRELIERRTPEGYLLSVFALGEDFKQTAQPLVELCNPGTGANKSEYTSNLKKLREQYESRFFLPLMRQAEELLAPKPAKASPILEMVQLVGINGFRKHHVSGERRLIIMSDMLHNTPPPGLSMYERPLDYAEFASSDYAKKVQADLAGVEVEIHYLMHTPRLQTKRNLKFWEDYFDKAGARVVAVRPMEG
jgi:hypothetical protein